MRRRIWQFKRRAPRVSSRRVRQPGVAVAGDRVFMETDERMYCVNRGPEVLWDATLPTAADTIPPRGADGRGQSRHLGSRGRTARAND